MKKRLRSKKWGRNPSLGEVRRGAPTTSDRFTAGTIIGLTAGAGVAIGLVLAQGIALVLEFAAVRIGWRGVVYVSLLGGLMFGWFWAFAKWQTHGDDMPKLCAKCGGELIGSELAYGTCGHCGGRAKRG